MSRDLVVGRTGARFLGRTFPVAIGRAGLARDKREGDGASPVGVFALRRLYWRADRLARPRAALPAAPIGPRLGWSDDPADPRYNHPVRLPSRFSAERLRRADPLYDVVATTSHNEDGTPGAGSAIFLHVWRGPRRSTAGCVALSRADLLWVLRRWTPRSRLVIGPRSGGRG